MPAISDAVNAATRFGFAARGDDLSLIAKDPRDWVLGQLTQRPAALPGDLPSSETMVAAQLEMRRDKGNEDAKKAFQERAKSVYFAEIAARVGAAVASDAPLLERLTQ